MNNSALSIILRKLRWRERLMAINILKRLINKMPKKTNDDNPFQWIVFAYIATLILFFGTFIFILN